jgi:DNA-binding response OmpR family regulator
MPDLQKNSASKVCNESPEILIQTVMKDRVFQNCLTVELPYVSAEGSARHEGAEWSFNWVERVDTSRVPETLRVGVSLIHRRTGKVETPTGEHHLRLKEMELLLHFFQHVTVTFTREELLQMVWKCHPHLLTRTVDQTIATLRKKIEVAPEHPRFLQTVYGVGYRLVLPNATHSS